jgi:hypothetical protein
MARNLLSKSAGREEDKGVSGCHQQVKGDAFFKFYHPSHPISFPNKSAFGGKGERGGERKKRRKKWIRTKNKY